jgi:hypothetical protein
MRSNKLCTVLFLRLTGVPSLDAQVSASITGVITDTSGARVPSAAITVKNVETAAIRGTVSDEALVTHGGNSKPAQVPRFAQSHDGNDGGRRSPREFTHG